MIRDNYRPAGAAQRWGSHCRVDSSNLCRAGYNFPSYQLFSWNQCLGSIPPCPCPRCARGGGLDWGALSSCARGQEGQDLHRLAGERTHALYPRVTFIPTIGRTIPTIP